MHCTTVHYNAVQRSASQFCAHPDIAINVEAALHYIKTSGQDMACRLPPSYSFRPVWKAQAIGLYLDSLDKIDVVRQKQSKGDATLPPELLRPIRTKRASEQPRVLPTPSPKGATRKRARDRSHFGSSLPPWSVGGCR